MQTRTGLISPMIRGVLPRNLLAGPVISRSGIDMHSQG